MAYSFIYALNTEPLLCATSDMTMFQKALALF